MQDVKVVDWQVIRTQEFPITREYIFVNHAATSPLPARTVQACVAVLQAHHRAGSLANPGWAKLRQRTREKIARFIGATPEEIAFMRNTSEGLLLVAAVTPWHPGDNVVTVEGEFPANVFPWLQLARREVETRFVPRYGERVEPDQLFRWVDERTRAIAISAVQYLDGFRTDLPALGARCRERGIYFIVDAIQALGAFPIDVEVAGIDFLACGGHKWLLAPKGIGFLYISRRVWDDMVPTHINWGSYEWPAADFDYRQGRLKPDLAQYEEGTPNFVGMAGLEASLDLFTAIGPEVISGRILAVTRHLIDGLRTRGYHVLGSDDDAERSGIVTFVSQGQSATELFERLQAAQVVASLRAGGIRVAPHFYNTREEMDALLDVLPTKAS